MIDRKTNHPIDVGLRDCICADPENCTQPVPGRRCRRIARHVVCAAIRAADGSLLLGIRHYSADMRAQIQARHDGAKFEHRHDEDQGFVDQHGVFMSREEAFRVAADGGQLNYPDRCGVGLNGRKLYSEGLY